MVAIVGDTVNLRYKTLREKYSRSAGLTSSPTEEKISSL